MSSPNILPTSSFPNVGQQCSHTCSQLSSSSSRLPFCTTNCDEKTLDVLRHLWSDVSLIQATTALLLPPVSRSLPLSGAVLRNEQNEDAVKAQECVSVGGAIHCVSVSPEVASRPAKNLRPQSTGRKPMEREEVKESLYSSPTSISLANYSPSLDENRLKASGRSPSSYLSDHRNMRNGSTPSLDFVALPALDTPTNHILFETSEVLSDEKEEKTKRSSSPSHFPLGQLAQDGIEAGINQQRISNKSRLPLSRAGVFVKEVVINVSDPHGDRSSTASCPPVLSSLTSQSQIAPEIPNSLLFTRSTEPFPPGKRWPSSIEKPSIGQHGDTSSSLRLPYASDFSSVATNHPISCIPLPPLNAGDPPISPKGSHAPRASLSKYSKLIAVAFHIQAQHSIYICLSYLQFLPRFSESQLSWVEDLNIQSESTRLLRRIAETWSELAPVLPSTRLSNYLNSVCDASKAEADKVLPLARQLLNLVEELYLLLVGEAPGCHCAVDEVEREVDRLKKLCRVLGEPAEKIQQARSLALRIVAEKSCTTGKQKRWEDPAQVEEALLTLQHAISCSERLMENCMSEIALSAASSVDPLNSASSPRTTPLLEKKAQSRKSSEKAKSSAAAPPHQVKLLLSMSSAPLLTLSVTAPSENKVKSIKVETINSQAKLILGPIMTRKESLGLCFFAPVDETELVESDSKTMMIWYHRLREGLQSLPRSDSEPITTASAVKWLCGQMGLREVAPIGPEGSGQVGEDLLAAVSRCAATPESPAHLVVLDTATGAFHGVDAYRWENSRSTSVAPVYHVAVEFHYILSPPRPPPLPLMGQQPSHSVPQGKMRRDFCSAQAQLRAREKREHNSRHLSAPLTQRLRAISTDSTHSVQSRSSLESRNEGCGESLTRPESATSSNAYRDPNEKSPSIRRQKEGDLLFSDWERHNSTAVAATSCTDSTDFFVYPSSDIDVDPTADTEKDMLSGDTVKLLGRKEKKTNMQAFGSKATLKPVRSSHTPSSVYGLEAFATTPTLADAGWIQNFLDEAFPSSAVDASKENGKTTEKTPSGENAAALFNFPLPKAPSSQDTFTSKKLPESVISTIFPAPFSSVIVESNEPIKKDSEESSGASLVPKNDLLGCATPGANSRSIGASTPSSIEGVFPRPSSSFFQRSRVVSRNLFGGKINEGDVGSMLTGDLSTKNESVEICRTFLPNRRGGAGRKDSSISTSLQPINAAAMATLLLRGNEVDCVKLLVLVQRFEQVINRRVEVFIGAAYKHLLSSEILINNALLQMVFAQVIQLDERRREMFEGKSSNLAVFLSLCGSHLVVDLIPLDRVPVKEEERENYRMKIEEYYREREAKHTILFQTPPSPVALLTIKKEKEVLPDKKRWIDAVLERSFLFSLEHAPPIVPISLNSTYNAHSEPELVPFQHSLLTPSTAGKWRARHPELPAVPHVREKRTPLMPSVDSLDLLPEVWAVELGLSESEKTLVHPRWYLNEQLRDMVVETEAAVIVTGSGAASIAFPIVTQAQLAMLKSSQIVAKPLVFANDRGLVALIELLQDMEEMKRQSKEEKKKKVSIVSLGYNVVTKSNFKKLAQKPVNFPSLEELRTEASKSNFTTPQERSSNDTHRSNEPAESTGFSPTPPTNSDEISVRQLLNPSPAPQDSFPPPTLPFLHAISNGNGLSDGDPIDKGSVIKNVTPSGDFTSTLTGPSVLQTLSTTNPYQSFSPSAPLTASLNTFVKARGGCSLNTGRFGLAQAVEVSPLTEIDEGPTADPFASRVAPTSSTKLKDAEDDKKTCHQPVPFSNSTACNIAERSLSANENELSQQTDASLQNILQEETQLFNEDLMLFETSWEQDSNASVLDYLALPPPRQQKHSSSSINFPYFRVLLLHSSDCQTVNEWLMSLGHCVFNVESIPRIIATLRCGISVFDAVFVEWSKEVMNEATIELLEEARKKDFGVPVFCIWLGNRPPEALNLNMSSSACPDMHEEKQCKELGGDSNHPPLPPGLFPVHRILHGPSVIEAVAGQRFRIRSEIRLGRIVKDLQGECNLPFQITRRIGSGGFADVYEVILFASKAHLALKRIPVGSMSAERMDEIYKEVAILRQLEHRNVIQLSHFSFDGSYISLFLELCECSLEDLLLSGLTDQQLGDLNPDASGMRNGDSYSLTTPVLANSIAPLQGGSPMAVTGIAKTQHNVSHHYLGCSTPSTTSHRSTVHAYAHKNLQQVHLFLAIRDIVSAVKYLHSFDIVHRDIKPQNILFLNGVAKLADFGSATTVSGTQKALHAMKGTLPYMAPEVFLGELYRKSCDVWSLGILIAEILGLHLAHFSLLHFPALQEFYKNLNKDGSMPVVVTNFVEGAMGKIFPQNITDCVKSTLSEATKIAEEEQLQSRTEARFSYAYNENPTSAEDYHVHYPSSGGSRPSQLRTIYAIEINTDQLVATSSRHQLPASLIELLESTFHRTPEKRITTEQLLEHPIANDREWLHRMLLEARHLNMRIGTKREGEGDNSKNFKALDLSFGSNEAASGDDEW